VLVRRNWQENVRNERLRKGRIEETDCERDSEKNIWTRHLIYDMIYDRYDTM
jgi:hypothetical protein